MTKPIIFWSLEFTLCFLFTLNLFMRGRLTTVVGSILGLLMFGMVIAAIFILGWSYALLSFLLMWVFVAISRPFAGMVAFRILGFRTGIESPTYQQSPNKNLITGKETVEELFKRIGEDQKVERARIASIASQPDIASLLQGMSLQPNELRKLRILLAESGSEERIKVEAVYKLEKLHTLLLHCALPDVSWEILSNPDELRRLIEFQRQGLQPAEIGRRFRHFA